MITQPKIEMLSWIVGSWRGSLGPLTVEEIWMPPLAGSMQMMIRLTSPEGLAMSEMLMVRETESDSGFVLHLRQYSPALELLNGQDLQLEDIGSEKVSFIAAEENQIRYLSYELIAEDQLKVIVTDATGNPQTAELHRS